MKGLLFLLIIGNIFYASAQYDELFYQQKTDTIETASKLAVTVRYDTGIDSIIFPIDSSKIYSRSYKYAHKESNLIALYAYYFTAKVTGKYKLPDGIVWSKNQSYSMVFKDSLYLLKYDSFVPTPLLSKNNSSIKTPKKPKKINEDGRKLDLNSKKIKFIGWSDKKKYTLSDTIKIVFEMNKNYFYEKVKPFEIKGLRNMDKSYKNETDSGHEWSSFSYTIKPLKKGQYIIPPLELKVDSLTLKTKPIRFIVQ